MHEPAIPDIWSSLNLDWPAISEAMGLGPPDPQPLMSESAWLFIMEQYALECADEGLVIHPETVLRWIKHFRDDHPELED